MNFELHVRLSSQSKARWDRDFIENTLSEYIKLGSQIGKIWVCGPPKMNEDFDKSLEELYVKLGINRYNYEIM